MLDKVKKKAKKLNIKGDIKYSTRKDKKYMIIKDNKKIHFGQKGYDDFLMHNDDKRRKSFHNRFKSNKGYNDPNSGLYYSRKLLW